MEEDVGIRKRLSSSKKLPEEESSVTAPIDSCTFTINVYVLLLIVAVALGAFVVGFWVGSHHATDAPTQLQSGGPGTAAHQKRKESLLLSLKENHVRFGISSIDGVGVIASRDILAGTEIFPPLPNTLSEQCEAEAGENVVLSEAEVEALPEDTKMRVKGFFSRTTQNDGSRIYVLDRHGLAGLRLDSFLNHADKDSDAENMEMRFVKRGDPSSPWSESAFFASRNIKKGEELLLDYCIFGQGDQFDFNHEYFSKCSSRR